MFHTTSWCSRPALPLLFFTYLFLIVSPIAGFTYDYRANRQKRSPNEAKKVTKDFEANLDRIFKIGSDTGLVLFNTTTAGTPTNNNNNNNQNTQHNNRNNDAIIFSDDGYLCGERLKGKPYCLEVPNYLESSRLDKIDENNFEKFKSYFKDDVVPPPDITQRMNSDPQEEYYCSSRSHLIYPKSAETMESKWLLVVQHENHKQGILVEQCDEEDTPCRFHELLPKFYTSRCKQNYIYRTMVVSVDGKLREEQVKMPSCCKCVLRYSQN
ncbi:protein spaetzle isoform X3 [Bactrocera dorsalis]|uniref:Protein spaetzle n=1 Tax=Bactrocera dorsalis TaxID=27457 RepID=A0A034W3H1_BACDO|nr:protein spaetzle isoform X3 [Bactrocera dorsalis]